MRTDHTVVWKLFAGGVPGPARRARRAPGVTDLRAHPAAAPGLPAGPLAAAHGRGATFFPPL